jgi:hypothetical protein
MTQPAGPGAMALSDFSQWLADSSKRLHRTHTMRIGVVLTFNLALSEVQRLCHPQIMFALGALNALRHIPTLLQAFVSSRLHPSLACSFSIVVVIVCCLLVILLLSLCSVYYP